MKGGYIIKVVVKILETWVELSGNDTIDGVNYNVASPELFPTPKFVEIIHKGQKFYINSIFIQYVSNGKSNWELSDRRII